ncbi:MAG TPA: CHAD domain-containing protein, partial [Moraxellaceae bacterium]|nr:CHAD domain-containing protein [Moraxellaceae bacterium]
MRPRIFRQQLDALQTTLARRVDELVRVPAPDTLHALRVALRRMRTLLRPLAGRKAFSALYEQAGRVLEATGPLRDIEVLIEDLAAHQREHAAYLRQRRLDAGLMELIGRSELLDLEAECRPRPAHAPLIALPDREALEKRCRKVLERDHCRLLEQLQAPGHDLHRLRLDIKQLRYQLEARMPPAGDRRVRELENAQNVLGRWHDRQVWLSCARDESDLQSCVSRWTRESNA